MRTLLKVTVSSQKNYTGERINSKNLVIIAEVDDNDVYGNLTTEKTVPWGESSQYVSAFNQRSLFARRGLSPLWLEWMAYSIIAAVWGVLLFLFLQIRKIKKLA